MVANEDIKEEIVKILSKHPEGMEITEISKTLRIHRHTISKYIFALSMVGILEQREVGRAKVCFLKKGKRGGMMAFM